MANNMTSTLAAGIDSKSIDREPFLPPPDRWNEVYSMLCGHCGRQPQCQLVKSMLDFARGHGLWPDNAWVTDPGAGATCLSYAPKFVPTMPGHRAAALAEIPEEQLPTMCGGCAAQKGSEASVALHTQRDYKAAVLNRYEFNCHEDPEGKRVCGGWCRAVRRRDA